MNVLSDYKVGNYRAKTDHSTNLKLQYPIKRVKKKANDRTFQTLAHKNSSGLKNVNKYFYMG